MSQFIKRGLKINRHTKRGGKHYVMIDLQLLQFSCKCQFTISAAWNEWLFWNSHAWLPKAALLFFLYFVFTDNLIPDISPKNRAVGIVGKLQNLLEEMYFAECLILLNYGCLITPMLEITQDDESFNKQNEKSHLQVTFKCPNWV